ncbi:MAG TPA: serine hydrolase domain-containing protein [Gemmataceae bacterium]|nr:serine hydrolase domain-containing protein [Gemmataceae bacterium]
MKSLLVRACLAIALPALLFVPAGAQEPSPEASKKIVAALQPFVDRHTLAGAVVVVADKGGILCQEAVGYSDIAAKKPMEPDAIFWIASQSKSITAAAFMMLLQEDRVQLDDPVEKFLPEFKDQVVMINGERHKPRHPITVREILSHTSGLQFSTPAEKPTLDVLTLKEAAKSYAETPLLFEPGAKYQYSNAGINTAGRIIEVVSGMPYEDFLQKRVFDEVFPNLVDDR